MHHIIRPQITIEPYKQKKWGKNFLCQVHIPHFLTSFNHTTKLICLISNELATYSCDEYFAKQNCRAFYWILRRYWEYNFYINVKKAQYFKCFQTTIVVKLKYIFDNTNMVTNNMIFSIFSFAFRSDWIFFGFQWYGANPCAWYLEL